MERICIDMPRVSQCKVTECAYNKDQECHARAITVGAERPACDTYFRSDRRTNEENTAGVGACHVDVCMYNNSFECQAPNIVVDRGEDAADCMTFRKRM